MSECTFRPKIKGLPQVSAVLGVRAGRTSLIKGFTTAHSSSSLATRIENKRVDLRLRLIPYNTQIDEGGATVAFTTISTAYNSPQNPLRQSYGATNHDDTPFLQRVSQWQRDKEKDADARKADGKVRALEGMLSTIAKCGVSDSCVLLSSTK